MDREQGRVVAIDPRQQRDRDRGQPGQERDGPATRDRVRRDGPGRSGRTSRSQPTAATSSGRRTAGSNVQPSARLAIVGGSAGTRRRGRGRSRRARTAATERQPSDAATGDAGRTAAHRRHRRTTGAATRHVEPRHAPSLLRYDGRRSDPRSDAAFWPAPISTWRRRRSGFAAPPSSRTVDVDHPRQQAINDRDHRLADRRRRSLIGAGGPGGPERPVDLEQLLPAGGEERRGPADPRPLRHRLRDRRRRSSSSSRA